MRIFVSGDRSLDKITSIFAVAAAMNAATEKWSGLGEIAFVTGDQPGVEAAARYLLGQMTPAYSAVQDANDRPDFDLRHAEVRAGCDAAVVIHGDPLTSRITRSLLEAYGDQADERVLLVTG